MRPRGPAVAAQTHSPPLLRPSSLGEHTFAVGTLSFHEWRKGLSPFLPRPPSLALISCARNREWKGCLPSGRDWPYLPYPSQSITPFRQIPPLDVLFRKWLRPYFSPLSARTPPFPSPLLRSFQAELKRLKAAAASQRRHRPLARCSGLVCGGGDRGSVDSQFSEEA